MSTTVGHVENLSPPVSSPYLERAIRASVDQEAVVRLAPEACLASAPDLAMEVLTSPDRFRKSDVVQASDAGFRAHVGSAVAVVNGQEWQNRRTLIDPVLYSQGRRWVQEAERSVDRWITSVTLRPQRLERSLLRWARDLCLTMMVGTDPDVRRAGSCFLESSLAAQRAGNRTRENRRLAASAARFRQKLSQHSDRLSDDASSFAGMLYAQGVDERDVHLETLGVLHTGSKSLASAACGVVWYAATAETSTWHDASPAARVREVLRLHPPYVNLVRRATTGVTLADTGIEADQTVLVNVMGLHRDPHLWADPAVLRPDRWTGTAASIPGSYLPFGGGQRRCPVRGFMQSTLETLVEGLDGRTVRLGLQRGLSLTVDDSGLRVRPDPWFVVVPGSSADGGSSASCADRSAARRPGRGPAARPTRCRYR